MRTLADTIRDLGLEAGGPGSGRHTAMTQDKYDKVKRLAESARKIGNHEEADAAEQLMKKAIITNRRPVQEVSNADLRDTLKPSFVPEQSRSGFRSWFTKRTA